MPLDFTQNTGIPSDGSGILDASDGLAFLVMVPESQHVLHGGSMRNISHGLHAAQTDTLLPEMFLGFIHLACSDFQGSREFLLISLDVFTLFSSDSAEHSVLVTHWSQRFW